MIFASSIGQETYEFLIQKFANMSKAQVQTTFDEKTYTHYIHSRVLETLVVKKIWIFRRWIRSFFTSILFITWKITRGDRLQITIRLNRSGLFSKYLEILAMICWCDEPINRNTLSFWWTSSKCMRSLNCSTFSAGYLPLNEGEKRERKYEKWFFLSQNYHIGIR